MVKNKPIVILSKWYFVFDGIFFLELWMTLSMFVLFWINTTKKWQQKASQISDEKICHAKKMTHIFYTERSDICFGSQFLFSVQNLFGLFVCFFSRTEIREETFLFISLEQNKTKNNEHFFESCFFVESIEKCKKNWFFFLLEQKLFIFRI